ncbi:MAG: tetratricopeptide repeat protein [Brevundimonas sp.]|nr:tetratricopeptide repeat protein [Brevundimonas sp.]
MRLTALRSFLLAATILGSPALAQEAPAPRIQDVLPEPPPPPLVVIGEGQETPAPTIDAIPRVWAPSPRDETGRTAYGLFLSGRSALSQGEFEQGAAFLSAVQTLAPEQPSVMEQATTAALLAGDLSFAARAASSDTSLSAAIGEAADLVSAVLDFERGDARRASSSLKADPVAAPHARAGALVQPWIAAAAGDWEIALAEPNPTGDPLVVVFGRYNRAQLLEHRRRHDDAEAVLRALVENPRTAPVFRVSYGEFLERRGRRDEALSVYDAAISAGSADPALSLARARAASRGRPPALPSLREGAAEALTIAARQASSENAEQFAVVYLRLAVALDRTPETLYLLGQTATQEEDLRDLGLSVLARVPEQPAEVHAAAQVQMGLTLAAEDRREEALAAFQAAQRSSPDDARIAQVTVGQLMQLQRYEEALVLLNGPLLNTVDQTADVRFLRGAAYESLDRIPEAEAELWTALQSEPNEPIYLNYLGYLWVDSGTRVAEGAEMIERAHAADPEDGNIQDSLGWAQFRQGQYEIAVDTLEQAVAKEPANAEINDHLGDAYWMVGRRREAGFQWSRVLTLDPDAERRAEVERKLLDGLTPEASVGAGL